MDIKSGKRTLNQRCLEILAALAFFTRIPVPSGPWQQVPLAASMRMLPLVGVVVGTAVGLVYWLIANIVSAPALAAAAVAVATGVLLTGALHEDGLADFWDGFGGNDRARRLAIMRDSHLGSYGAIALVIVLTLRIAVISAATPSQIAGLLISAAALSRAAAVAMAHLLPPARLDGLSASAGMLPLSVAAGAVVMALLVTVITLPLAALLPSVIAASIGTAAIYRLSHHRLGGQTGDVLGATQQLSEALVLITVLNISV